MLNIGIISTWHVHTDDYAGQLLSSGKTKIIAVWDFDAAMGAPWAAAHGAEFMTDYDAFLARKDIDAVVCNAPTTMHPELLEKAARAGKHIFTEKLLATNVADCARMCETIAQSGVIFTISLPMRMDPRVRYAKQLVDEGVLGKIVNARFRRSHSGIIDGWLPERWFDVSMTGGGALMDLGSHPVYVLSYFFGTPIRVNCLMTSPFGTSSDENAFAIAEFEGGIIGSMETGFITYGVPDILEIYGTDGALFMRGDDMKLTTRKTTTIGVKEASPVQLPDPMPSPVIQFADACLAHGQTPIGIGLQDALIMTRIIEAAYESNRTGHTIELNKATVE